MAKITISNIYPTSIELSLNSKLDLHELQNTELDRIKGGLLPGGYVAVVAIQAAASVAKTAIRWGAAVAIASMSSSSNSNNSNSNSSGEGN